MNRNAELRSSGSEGASHPEPHLTSDLFDLKNKIENKQTLQFNFLCNQVTIRNTRQDIWIFTVMMCICSRMKVYIHGAPSLL